MRPSPVLCSRIKSRAIRLTTKSVNKGYYKGTGTGSMGSHTAYGNYLIDWRKVRHYVVPDMRNCKLTPFVSEKIYEKEDHPTDLNGVAYNPRKVDGSQYLKWWMRSNPQEVTFYRNSSPQNNEDIRNEEAAVQQAHSTQPKESSK